MAYLEWTNDMSVNVEQLDEEHKKLIELINYLYSIVMTRNIVNHVEAEKKAISQMINYASYHFASEEKYMLQFHYPDYKEHKKEHDEFVKQARRYKAYLDTSGFILSLEILDYLRDWLKKHTLGMDKKYSRFFNEHGLQ